MHIPRLLIIPVVLAVILTIPACGGRNATEEDAPTRGAAQLYEDASRQLGIGGYQQAIAYLERLELFYPFSEYTRRGQLDLIYAYYRNGETESAIDAANEFIRENPTHPDVDYAYYLRGLIYFDRDRNPLEKAFRADLTERPPADAERSLSYFAELVRRYPDSDYADDARQRIVYLRERIARYHLHVADYYMTRNAWLAAVNRARTVVETFADTAEVANALQIMARAYRELGMDDLAADAERVLDANPQAPRARQSRGGLFKRDRRARPQRPVADGNDG
ncbi:MAG: outer membrane protein assembly factor BamD [Gammaproteobacteria bacterium]|nr:outer membrane protein assembly factor BamD [Gammaproteobacteria bacterium]